MGEEDMQRVADARNIVQRLRAQPPRPRFRETTPEEAAEVLWAADILEQYGRWLEGVVNALCDEREAMGRASMDLGPKRGE